MKHNCEDLPVISIVLPTYNQAHYLPLALDSIFDQTFKEFELIVVNDGSTDDTSRVLEEYRARFDFRVVEQENQGLPRALNAGFAQARGKYYTWTSSDNIMLPTMLEELYSALQGDPSVDVVYADWYTIDEAGNTVARFQTIDFDRHLLLRQNFVHCCFLFNRECMKKIGDYDPNFIYCEDWEFWIRVSQHFKMKRVPRALYKYRVHSGSMTTEIIEDRAPRMIGYESFSTYLKKQSLIDWYISKIKWKLLIIRLGYSPLSVWHEHIGLPEIS